MQCGHFRPKWGRLKYNKVTKSNGFFAGFSNNVIAEVFLFLLVKLLFKLVNVGIFLRFFFQLLFLRYISVNTS